MVKIVVSRCNNVGILHNSHSSSQSSLWDKSMNSFRKASSPNVSTTIFTILVSFWFGSLRIRHLRLFHLGISHLGMFPLGICHFWNSSDISLENSTQIAHFF